MGSWNIPTKDFRGLSKDFNLPVMAQLTHPPGFVAKQFERTATILIAKTITKEIESIIMNHEFGTQLILLVAHSK
jgi:hypothetical protein